MIINQRANLSQQYIKKCRMKIEFKVGEFKRKYDGLINYESLIDFVVNEFPSISNFYLTFNDEDNEGVMISSEVDVQAMVDWLGKKQQMVTIDVVKNEGQLITFIDEEKKRMEKQKEDNRKESSKSYQESQKKPEKHNRSDRKQQKRQKLQHKLIKKINKFQQTLKTSIMEDIKTSLKHEIPCIVNQVEMKIKNKEFEELAIGQCHEGVRCNGCNTEPIVGIRYKCSQECDFNLCEVCEENVEHEHHLLKIRKHVEKARYKKTMNREERDRKMAKFARKFVKICRSSSCSSSQSKQKRKRHHHRNHRDQNQKMHFHKRQHWRRFGSHPHPPQHPHSFNFPPPAQFNPFCFPPPAQFCFPPPPPHQFNSTSSETSKVYEQCFSQKFQRKKQDKLRKLAIYFGKDESQFVDLVQQNPDAKVPQLLKMLKEQNKYDFNPNDEEKLTQMRKQFKKQSNTNKWGNFSNSLLQSKNSKNEQVPIAEVSKPTEPTQKEETKSKSEKIREKGKILMNMKQLFGNQNAGEIYKFIQKHFDLGEDGIIELYINQQFERQSI